MPVTRLSKGLPPEGLVLDVAAPEPGILAKMDAMLTSIPEGWGVITAEALNTELIENPDLILIDVRRAEEVAENGVIAADTVTLIPLEALIELQADVAGRPGRADRRLLRQRSPLDHRHDHSLVVRLHQRPQSARRIWRLGKRRLPGSRIRAAIDVSWACGRGVHRPVCSAPQQL